MPWSWGIDVYRLFTSMEMRNTWSEGGILCCIGHVYNSLGVLNI